MKKLYFFILMIVFIGASVAWAEQFTLGSSVTFESPEGFTELSQSEIALKYPSNRAPRFVVGNRKRSTTIAYDLKPHNIPENKLNEVKASFIQTFERIIPGLVWIEEGVIQHDGKSWIYLEMTSRAIDTDIHNIMMMTPHAGQLLMFNFNSTKEEFSRVEKELRRSIDSIRVGKD